jgi:type IV pilus assembly protein PilB
MALVKRDLGDLLVENGLISPQEWEQAQLEREKTGEPISLILARLGIASENQVKNALELQYGVNYLSLRKIEKYPVECMTLLPESLMRQHQVVPVSKDGNRVTITMVNPNNLTAIDDIKMRLKGMQVKLSVCTEDDFQLFMETIYTTKKPKKTQTSWDEDEEEPETDDKPQQDEVVQTDFMDSDVDLTQMDLVDDTATEEEGLEKQSSDKPIIMLANQILAKAINFKMSDIHVEPQEKNVVIRCRRDGVLVIDRKLPKAILSPLVSRFKVMSNLDIAERRVPQDGRIRVRLAGRDIDFRVSTLPSKFGEKVVMRILDKSNTQIGLSRLITDPSALETIRDMCKKPFGIIYVTGPTGSGKTTSLYSALAERNSPDVNIVTAEDPIEYDMSGITQVQVLREKGLDFARILRSFLRQDPDIILVGETRDHETAKIAIEAALTGHLVFTTLHTNDAPGAVTRLEEMEIEPFLIASATIGIIAQRLVRRICNDCKEEYSPQRSLLEYLHLLDKSQENLAEATIQFYHFKTDSKGWPIFYKGKGCEKCNGSGYRGRIGCYEVMRLNDELRQLIAKGSPTALIRYAAKKAGMIPLKEYSLRLVGEGYTTPDECIRVTISDTAGEDALCPKCRKQIGENYARCPFCQHEIIVYCPRCSALQEEDWLACAKCGLSKADAERDRICSECEAEVAGIWQCCPYCQTPRELKT